MSDVTNFFTPDPAQEPDPGFPVHTITATSIEYEKPVGNHLVEMVTCEYEIDHGTCTLRGEECIVEGTVANLGLHGALYGVWDAWDQGNRLEERDYRVRGWTSKYDIPGEPIEYDAGIEEVDDDDNE